MENEVKTAPAQERRQLDYQELENVAQQLSVQVQQLNKKNNQLIEMINQANLENLFKRLEWLWRIITTDGVPVTSQFKKKCAEEFMLLMETPKDTETPKE